jgi:HSP20 family protein
MTALTRWDPFAEMDQLQNRLAYWFDQPSRAESEVTWAPAIDVCETNEEYIVKADLPEVTKDNLSVTLENGVLTISGERKFTEQEGVEYLNVERPYGKFLRSLELPDDANAEGINAEFKNGLLSLHIAKHESAKPRTIEIQG